MPAPKYRLANSLDKLRSQINTKYPNRDKKSDGWIGDAKHKSRSSDHNAWFNDKRGSGIVSALDIDKDLTPTVKVDVIVNALFASKDKRIKYIIFNLRITERNKQGVIYKWIPYHGKNSHKEHAHVSVKSDANLFDDASNWSI
jgi:hypothetical protein